MGYLTPDSVPTGATCRALYIPDSPEYLAIVRGLLQTLTFPEYWDKQGTLTPQQAAESCVEMFERFCLRKERACLIGTVIAMYTETMPDYCLACDGSGPYEQEDYPELFDVLPASAKFGTQFWTPDLIGRSIIGAGEGHGFSPHFVGDNGGSENETLSIAQIPAHTHAYTSAIPTLINGGLEAPAAAAQPSPAITSSAGLSQAHNNMPPYIALSYYIIAR